MSQLPLNRARSAAQVCPQPFNENPAGNYRGRISRRFAPAPGIRTSARTYCRARNNLARPRTNGRRPDTRPQNGQWSTRTG